MTMIHRVTKPLLLEMIAKASENQHEFKKLREFIFDYYYGEDDYIFETEGLEIIFAVLSSYLEFAEAYGDPLKPTRLSRLKAAFQQGGWSVEHTIYALESDKLGDLLSRHQTGAISEQILELQVRKLAPISFDWKRVISLYQNAGKELEKFMYISS
jgi:hypothetical protein